MALTPTNVTVPSLAYGRHMCYGHFIGHLTYFLVGSKEYRLPIPRLK